MYFDDILVYSRDETSDVEHISQVFQVLRQQKLYAKLQNCNLFSPYGVFLGYIILGDGTQVHDSKVEIIKS